MADEQGKGSGLATRLALLMGLARDADGKRLGKPYFLITPGSPEG